MKPSALLEALHALISQRVPLHIWGACGVGKCQIVNQVARDRKVQFLDVRAVQLDPVDLRGLPRISSDQTEWVPPKFLPTSGEGILFLDKLTSAPPPAAKLHPILHDSLTTPDCMWRSGHLRESVGRNRHAC
jgi:MoxR-like ATPase